MRKRPSIHWFTLQVSSAAGDGPGWNQEPDATFGSPKNTSTWTSFGASPGALVGRWIRCGTTGTWTDTYVECWWQLNLAATTPALIREIFYLCLAMNGSYELGKVCYHCPKILGALSLHKPWGTLENKHWWRHTCFLNLKKLLLTRAQGVKWDNHVLISLAMKRRFLAFFPGGCFSHSSPCVTA